MDDNHVCQYGKCEDPPKYKIGTLTCVGTLTRTVPSTNFREMLVCDHHLELMKKSTSVQIISVQSV